MVYPFTPQQAISDAIIKASYIPVFCGVGGGDDQRVTYSVSCQRCGITGSYGCGTECTDLNLLAVSSAVDIPVIVTVTKEDTDIRARLEAGVSVLNIACGHQTCEVVRKLRAEYPGVPLIASGGNTEETVLDTILAGANAITYTLPSVQDMFKQWMATYREE